MLNVHFCAVMVVTNLSTQGSVRVTVPSSVCAIKPDVVLFGYLAINMLTLATLNTEVVHQDSFLIYCCATRVVDLK